MRIGVMSDTHNHLANVARIVELLNHAGIERVVHTGDITQPKTLEVLARLRAPARQNAREKTTITNDDSECCGFHRMILLEIGSRLRNGG